MRHRDSTRGTRIGLAWLPVVMLFAGCRSEAPPPRAEEVVNLPAARPLIQKVQEYLEYTGRIEAEESVEVRARVSGYLEKIAFESGSEVKAGQPLFVIDQRPYQAALKVAESQINLAIARRKQAETEVKRNEGLVSTGATTRAEFDKLVADRDVAIASEESARAQAETARLNLDFCTIKSPINGKTSRNLLSVGNLIAADSPNPLTTVVSQDPMFVYFDVEESTLLRFQDMLRQGKIQPVEKRGVGPIDIGLQTDPQDTYPYRGYIDFADNRVNPTTGTLRLRGVVPNPLLPNKQRVFTPGLFVRVRLPMAAPADVMLVNERAIGSDQGQKYVYVVAQAEGKEIAEYRPVTLGQAQKGGLRIVYPRMLTRARGELRLAEPGETGNLLPSLTPEDRIIVNGLQRVRPGQEVKVTEVPMPRQLPLLESKARPPAAAGS